MPARLTVLRALAALLLLFPCASDAYAHVARDVFPRATTPAPGPAAAHGGYAKGCVAGAVALPETAEGWQAMRLSRNRNWGHPALIAFIQRLSRDARAEGWPGLWVGDLSQPRGGPMSSGHASHQIGLDADIWLRRPDRLDLSRAERERIGSTSMVATNRRDVSAAWTPAHAGVIRRAAEDAAVARIFVNPAIKRELCRSTRGERGWLRKVRPWWGHDHHMHVRLACPPGGSGCVDQAPPPSGDGCDASLDWWFTQEALNPAPSDEPPPPPLRVADLPPACAGIAPSR